MKYNNDNVTRISAVAACNDETFHAFRFVYNEKNCIFFINKSKLNRPFENYLKVQNQLMQRSQIF